MALSLAAADIALMMGLSTEAGKAEGADGCGARRRDRGTAQLHRGEGDLHGRVALPPALVRPADREHARELAA